MKIGQMVSYLDTSLPPAAREVLSKLQSQSRPMAYEVVAAVVSQDLGQAPEKLFDSFEQTPFAAASIGQVHRAVLDGEPVAVKIKYPEIDKALSANGRETPLTSEFRVEGGRMISSDEAQRNE
jgi:predicted unusual protein kinase regulating ubiquinone biosynthesis (AarF/ABC1/UbiB family)